MIISPVKSYGLVQLVMHVEACPVLIDPLSIIFEMRRFMVMEQSSAPQELNLMMTNIENNAAPWQYNQADRLNWAHE